MPIKFQFMNIESIEQYQYKHPSGVKVLKTSEIRNNSTNFDKKSLPNDIPMQGSENLRKDQIFPHNLSAWETKH